MKLQNKTRLLSVILAVISVFSVILMAGCGQKTENNPVSSAAKKEDKIWADATYTEDKTFGEGAKTVTVEVIANGKSVTFTLKTDKENLADAMLEFSLVEGDNDQYGLYIKKVNGILADYNVDQHYWSLSKNGETLMTGASGVKIQNGEKYEFTYAK